MDLSTLRDRIDAVDRQIIALLAERLHIVEEVAPRSSRPRARSAIASARSACSLRLREHAPRPASILTRSSGCIA